MFSAKAASIRTKNKSIRRYVELKLKQIKNSDYLKQTNISLSMFENI